MKLPYGYVLIGGEIVVHEEKADVIRSIFDDYLAGASLGKIVDLLFKRGICPTEKEHMSERPEKRQNAGNATASGVKKSSIKCSGTE